MAKPRMIAKREAAARLRNAAVRWVSTDDGLIARQAFYRAAMICAATRVTGKGTPEERFWGYVQKTDGCWLWRGHTDVKGYGRFPLRRRSALAHRVSWEFGVGPIPDGLGVFHHCDNPPCVNPGHLFVGTVADNNNDKARKFRGGVGVFSANQVRSIRARVAAGERQGVIACELGVSPSTIYSLVRRESYAHVE